MMEEKNVLTKFVEIVSIIALLIGVIAVFYKLPGIVTERIGYRQIKKEKYNKRHK